jgi:hypothetical protein
VHDQVVQQVFDRVHQVAEFQLLENFEQVQLQHTDIHQQWDEVTHDHMSRALQQLHITAEHIHRLRLHILHIFDHIQCLHQHTRDLTRLHHTQDHDHLTDQADFHHHDQAHVLEDIKEVRLAEDEEDSVEDHEIESQVAEKKSTFQNSSTSQLKL